MRVSTTVHLPVDSLNDRFFNHAGDTFRELVRQWEVLGLVNVKQTQSGYVWLGTHPKHGRFVRFNQRLGEQPNGSDSVLLYDRPTMEWWQKAPPPAYKLALFGNTVPANINNAYPWIFWGRHPAQLERESQRLCSHMLSARPVKCVFIGKIENTVQQSFRDAAKWSSVVEHFRLVTGTSTPYPYNQTEYLFHLSQARFGLCLRGYGPKCNREIELMAMGTVLIVTPDVDMKNYFDPPVNGDHYLVVRSPDELGRVIGELPDDEWERMSRNCRDWYLRNASAYGSFYQTMRLVMTVSTSKLMNRPITQSISVPLTKLPGVKRVLIDTVFFERAFSGITRVWIGLLKSCAEAVATNAVEYVLLLRANSKNIPGDLLQRLPFVGIPTFEYSTSSVPDMKMLDAWCETLDADLFITTYFTWCTRVPNIVMIHDMIPERFRFPMDAMWKQKSEALVNADAYMCVSQSTIQDLIRFGPRMLEANVIHHIPNAFDSSIFEKADSMTVLEGTAALRSLGVTVPFVLAIIGNGNHYKNSRLLIDTLRMFPDAFNGATVVIVTTMTNPKGFQDVLVPIKFLNNITDTQLGLLYIFASFLIYPSRWEGFGLPILEAFHFECPVICCRMAGAIPEVAGDCCSSVIYVDADRPDELAAACRSIGTHGSADCLKRLNDFTLAKQFSAFSECVRFGLLKNKSDQFSTTTIMASLPNTLPSTTVTAEPAPVTSDNASSVPASSVPVKPFNGIHLIVQYFNCADAERQDEYDYCVKANLENSNVVKLHCLIEPETKVPDWLGKHAKYVEFKVIGRLTYRTAFDYANRMLAGQICAVSNLDIFLDQASKWEVLPGLFDMSIVMCLARHEFDGESSTKDKNLQKLAYATAQDCWVFQSPVFVKECDFALGRLGCDNAIAHRFRASGYIPVNAQDDFKVHHLDMCRKKTGENFLAHHSPNPEQPEERGYRLLPAYGAVQSVDKLLDDLKLGDVHKYLIICDIMSNFVRLDNPKPGAATAANAETK